MRIHLAQAASDTGQYDLLASELYCCSLMSFAYEGSVLQSFEKTWNGLVRIHLAGLPSQRDEIQSAGVQQIESHLTTYSDQKEVQSKERAFDMRLHLTDTTARIHGKRTVKDLLPEEGKTENLFSYAYNAQEEQWRDSRNHAMNIHLAGHSADSNMDAVTKPEHDAHLTSYADQKEVSNTMTDSGHRVDLRPRVIIDSGAFTAYSTGKIINPIDYAKWSLDFEKRWRHKMASLEFMNLDVIGDQEASGRNLKILEGLGMRPLPIFTYKADLRYLDEIIAEYSHFALGGLVGKPKPDLQKWLDACFARIIAQYKKTSVMPKVHLLGVTIPWALNRYPCYSSDSSSWVGCLRFGGGRAAGIKKLPRYKESDAAMSATIHTLRAEIRKYKKMQDDVTNLWKSRGIVFDD